MEKTYNPQDIEQPLYKTLDGDPFPLALFGSGTLVAAQDGKQHRNDE